MPTLRSTIASCGMLSSRSCPSCATLLRSYGDLNPTRDRRPLHGKNHEGGVTIFMNIEPIRYQWLDGQLKRFSDRLVAAVGLDEQEAAKVATSVAAEVRFLEPVARGQILAVSPVPLRDRLDELRAFQGWMELASKITGSAAVTRAQVITQNYVCFVYLGEACFRALRKASKPGSVTRRCCTYLTSNPVRAFRNSIAHSNWTYAPGFDALMFGARKGSDPNEALLRFDVASAELNFWQALSRGVAYAAYCSIEALEGRLQPAEP